MTVDVSKGELLGSILVVTYELEVRKVEVHKNPFEVYRPTTEDDK